MSFVHAIAYTAMFMLHFVFFFIAGLKSKRAQIPGNN